MDFFFSGKRNKVIVKRKKNERALEVYMVKKEQTIVEFISCSAPFATFLLDIFYDTD